MFRKTLILLLALCLALPLTAAAAPAYVPRGKALLESDVQSEFSHIRIRRQGNIRMMIFVRDNGEEAVQTMINIKKPYDMLASYCRFMFGSYLLQPRQKQVLIVGLGGGAMVKFYQHYDPQVKVDAVEIDPAVVKAAEQFFQTKSTENVHIITDDAFHYFETTKTRYDVIYMDAFLKPSQKTDTTGVPLELKTIKFYKGLQERLMPEGVVAVNVNVSSDLAEDVKTLRSAFAQTYVFRTQSFNLAVIGTWDKTQHTPAALRERAKELDRRFKTTFSFQEVVKGLGR